MANLKNNHRYSELNEMVYIFLHESDRIEFNACTGAVSVPWLRAMRVMSKYIFPAPKLLVLAMTLPMTSSLTMRMQLR